MSVRARANNDWFKNYFRTMGIVLDAVTFAAIPVVLALAALLASYLPARRAARIDPLLALRVE